ncbi:hypothetical protein GGX14DRAFT_584415 [Mycena pura]|uniref:RanBP2-type domain-containing protein n=1 Tax=Mycena pura TaxID=153505 RepID=A0AAD6YVT1_9AGAR|nr:hypothetical protein GGX14DRAFT_584415 [Mycena pura]
MTGAIRSQPRRSIARSATSKPYARPKQPPPKKSAWTIATGLFSFLNPLRLRSESRSDSDEDDDEPSYDGVVEETALSARGRKMAHSLATSAPPPPTESDMDPVSYMLPDSSSPKKNLETVASFLDQRRGQTISPLEAEGLISLIQKSAPVEKSEPFRFSSSVSLPSTPARGNSPVTPTNDIFTIGASASNPASAASPRRTLSKNPNGVYRWTGGGSARPSKNRYTSPAFGTPSRPSSPNLVFRDTPAQADASPKRRRLDTPPATPPHVPRSAAPAPSPTRVAAQQIAFPLSTPAPSPLATAPATPSRVTDKVNSLPVHPSPLRQAWGSSPASSSGGSSPAQGTPTKAATLLTALIRDADAEMPKRLSDVRNPYQAASPVSVRVTNTHPPDSRKRLRVTGRPLPPKEAEKLKEREDREKKEAVSPQAIIEATLPKGSKRSRPPAHLNGNANLNTPLPSPRRSPRLGSQPIEEEDEAEKNIEEREAGAPAPKRARLPNGNASVNGTTSAPKQDVDSVPAIPSPIAFPASASVPSAFSNGNSFGSGSSSTLPNGTSTGNIEFRAGPKPLATAPKEPSKLRYSFAPPPTPPPAADTATEKTLFPSPSTFILSAKSITNTAPATVPAPIHVSDPKEAARELPMPKLPSFVFASLTNTLSAGTHTATRDVASKLDKSALPSFEFAMPISMQDKGKEKAPLSPAPVQGFNWAAAGSAPPKPAGPAGSWTCGTCMLQNAPELDKCYVCESPR